MEPLLGELRKQKARDEPPEIPGDVISLTILVGTTGLIAVLY